MPLRPNFSYSMFLHFRNLYVSLTHLSKSFCCPSMGRPLFSTVFLEMFCPLLFKHVPGGFEGLVTNSPDVTSKTQRAFSLVSHLNFNLLNLRKYSFTPPRLASLCWKAVKSRCRNKSSSWTTEVSTANEINGCHLLAHADRKPKSWGRFEVVYCR